MNSQSRRIAGYDIARALAVMCMILVNFNVVLVMETGKAHPAWLAWLASRLEGRFAPLFVMLAGAGMSLMARGLLNGENPKAYVALQKRLIKRAMIFLFLGLLYTILWPADILHFYGIYILIGLCLLGVSTRRLWVSSGLSVLIFTGLVFVFNYGSNWDWSTLTYREFWTCEGMIRHLFFNGFHPVFPWVAFLIVGIWIGRQDLQERETRKRLLLGGLAIAVTAETFSWILIRLSFGGGLAAAISHADVVAIFGTRPMPPGPIYMVAASGTAIVILVLCFMLEESYRKARWMQTAVAVGQMSLSLYIAHVVVGMGILEALGRIKHQTLVFSMASGGLFCAASVLFAHYWKKRFRFGPLEYLLRQATR